MTILKRPLSPLAIVLILSAAFFAIFLMISGMIFMYHAPGGATKTSSKKSSVIFSRSGVGVIELNGVIMDSKKTLERLDAFADDDEVKAIVLRLNSPGGAVAPSQEIYQAVRNYKKPVVVSMSSMAASGAYYIACGAKKVFANPGTITGSIGVIMEFANLQKLYQWAKVERYVIKTGKFKDAGAEYREMTSEERALLQGMVDDVLVQFKTAVSTGRHLTMAQVTAIADGRIFSGNQAKNAKLVDDLGTLDDAVNEAGKMAGIKGKPEVIYLEKNHNRLLDLIMGGGGGDEDESQSQSRIGLLGAVQSLAAAVLGQTPLTSGDSGVAKLAGMSPGIYWLWSGVR